MDIAIETVEHKTVTQPCRPLPIHFSPYIDEALSSWYVRLSIAHFQIPFTFSKHTLPADFDIWKQDIDVVCPKRIVEKLGDRCAQPEDRLRRSTLEYWRCNFDPYDGTSTALPRWVSPACIRRKTPHHYGMRFCPDCIRSVQYFKLRWRLMYYVACPSHGIMMIDRCQRCASPISTHKLYKELYENLPFDSQCYCYSCGFDLRKSLRKSVSDRAQQYVSYLDEAVDRGYIHTAFGDIQYTHLFFQGLRLIMRGLAKPKLKSYLLEYHQAFGKIIDPLHKQKNDELEFLSVEKILFLLEPAMWLLSDWPNRFIVLCREEALNYTDWILPREVAPYWLSSVCKPFLRTGNITSH